MIVYYMDSSLKEIRIGSWECEDWRKKFRFLQTKLVLVVQQNIFLFLVTDICRCHILNAEDVVAKWVTFSDKSKSDFNNITEEILEDFEKVCIPLKGY